VLAAGGEHALGGSIVWSSDNLSKKAKLSCSYHILNTGDVMKHPVYLLVGYVILLDVSDQNVDDPVDVAVQEDFKLVEEGLAKQPIFTSPQKKVDGDCAEE
jgi:hypothetical protein